MAIRINALTLRDLEYVVAVAERRHFGQAAAACHVSQPALSAQVRKVEDALGVRLFERTNRRVEVTAIGEQVAAQARVVLDEAQRLGTVAARTLGPLVGPYRLGAIQTVGPYLLPFVLGPLRREFPRLELVLREGLTQDLVRELKTGGLDAVLAAATFTDPAVRQVPLFVEPFQLLAPRGHPLVTRRSLRASDLDARDMLLLEDGHCLADQALDLCPAGRRRGARRVHVTSLETLRHLVAAGGGYTIVPALAVADDPRLRRLVQHRRFDGRAPGRTIVLATREPLGRTADAEALADLIRRHLPAQVLPAR
jgi:LysR family hydrogen peroxide-inducible transcriptional activator